MFNSVYKNFYQRLKWSSLFLFMASENPASRPTSPPLRPVSRSPDAEPGPGPRHLARASQRTGISGHVSVVANVREFCIQKKINLILSRKTHLCTRFTVFSPTLNWKSISMRAPGLSGVPCLCSRAGPDSGSPENGVWWEEPSVMV